MSGQVGRETVTRQEAFGAKGRHSGRKRDAQGSASLDGKKKRFHTKDAQSYAPDRERALPAVPRLAGRGKDGVTVAGSLRPVARGGTGQTRLMAGRAARAQGRRLTAEHPWVQPCVTPPPGKPATPLAVTQVT